MQNYFETSFIDFNAPLYNNKEEEFFDDIFCSNPTKEWSSLTTASSAESTNYNNQYEAKFTELSNEFLIQDKITEKEEAPQAANCYKFCEYLANQVTLQLDDYQYCQQLTASFNDVFKGIIYFAGGEITNLKFFHVYPLNVISSLWTENKEALSARRFSNSEAFGEAEWNSFFAPQELVKKLDRITSNYKDMDYFIRFKDAVAKELAVSSYKRLLISCHATIINSILMSRAFKDQQITAEIPNLKDLVMIARECWLFKHYNQKRGKFALQCCKACDVCTSSLLPTDFLEKLQKSYQNYETISKFNNEMDILDSQSLNSEAIRRRFNFWTQTLWN
mmetsp:Transcript_20945/g.24233  ORF Transcript_20945/g.24233 Transcript_20945/m.24233 type:complete len:334 (-) Transcript_20945:243-1244(-)